MLPSRFSWQQQPCAGVWRPCIAQQGQRPGKGAFVAGNAGGRKKRTGDAKAECCRRSVGPPKALKSSFQGRLLSVSQTKTNMYELIRRRLSRMCWHGWAKAQDATLWTAAWQQAGASHWPLMLVSYSFCNLNPPNVLLVWVCTQAHQGLNAFKVAPQRSDVQSSLTHLRCGAQIDCK